MDVSLINERQIMRHMLRRIEKAHEKHSHGEIDDRAYAQHIDAVMTDFRDYIVKADKRKE